MELRQLKCISNPLNHLPNSKNPDKPPSLLKPQNSNIADKK